MSQGIFSSLEGRSSKITRVFAYLFNAAVAAAIVAGVALLWDDRAYERILIGGALVLVTVWSLLVAHKSWARLIRSRKDMDARSRWASELNDSSSWFAQAFEAAKTYASRTQADDGKWHLDNLPNASGLVEPIRAHAERNLTILRWSSGTAVLIGLFGTLIGLYFAIDGALGALTHSADSADDLGSAFGGALAPLKYAFFASGSGVMTSLALIFMRTQLEADMDAHFFEIDVELDSALHEHVFVGWQPPSQQFIATAQKLEGLNSRLMEVVQEISENTAEIMESAVTTIKEELKPLPDRLVETIDKGIQDGTTQAIADIARAQSRLLDKSNDVAYELEQLSQKLPELLEQALDNYISTSAKHAQEFSVAVDDLSSSVSGMVGELRTANDDTKDAIAEQRDAIGKLLSSQSQHIQSLQAASKKTADEIRKAHSSTATEVVKSANRLEAASTELLQNHEKFLHNLQATSSETAKQALAEQNDQMQDAFGELLSSQSEYIQSLQRISKETADEIRKAHSSTATEVVKSANRLEGASTELLQKHEKFLHNLQATTSEAAEQLIEKQNDQIRELGETSKEAADKFTTSVTTSFDAVSSSIEAAGSDVREAATLTRASTEELKNFSRDITELRELFGEFRTEAANLAIGIQSYSQTVENVDAAIQDQTEFIKKLVDLDGKEMQALDASLRRVESVLKSHFAA
jgi:methyl-accepting chemotaxis protein